ncbi:IS3 family transposase [Streptomyces sp. NBC_00289]|uniref:IS3 family transposase n=1 Tax=Streptomyces sp. NBC_00289 TaxID=2975703 RepID=UPI00325221B5
MGDGGQQVPVALLPVRGAGQCLAVHRDRRPRFPVQQMRTCAGVTTPGFYHWRSRPMSATAKRRAELRAVILQVFSDSHETYGYRRVHAALQRMNVQPKRNWSVR